MEIFADLISNMIKGVKWECLLLKVFATLFSNLSAQPIELYSTSKVLALPDRWKMIAKLRLKYAWVKAFDATPTHVNKLYIQWVTFFKFWVAFFFISL